MKIYRVGGAVRDMLLGEVPKEIDYVVVGATPEQLLKKGFKPVGKDFPVFLHPHTHEEYALARTERKSRPGYTGFQFYTSPNITLEQDLKRRDLTINAMAQSLQGKLIDPFGGQQDLQARKLQHVSSAFVEDPVRVLRIARFMARFSVLKFSISAETLILMKKIVDSGEIDTLVPERIWREFSKALNEASPVHFITTMAQCGALLRLFPDFNTLFSITFSSNESNVPNTEGELALSALEAAAQQTKDPMIRLVAFMQYIGQGEGSTKTVERIAKRLRLPTKYYALLQLSLRYRNQMYHVEQLLPETILTVFEKTDALRRFERFQKLLILCRIDYYVRYQQSFSMQEKKWIQAYEKIKSVVVTKRTPGDIQGKALGEQLRNARIEALSV